MLTAHIERPGDRVPPTEGGRLRLFLGSVDTYEAMSEAFSLPSHFNMLEPMEPAQRWTCALHAMMLRKYVAAEDEVCLTRIAAALEECVVGNPEDFHRMMALIRGQVRRLRTKGGPWQVIVDGDETTLARVMFDDLYGGLLHGDYGRWKRSVAMAVLLSDHALWDWTNDASHFVLAVNGQIRSALERGELNLDAGAPEPAVMCGDD